jgi:hypothetical protein
VRCHCGYQWWPARIELQTTTGTTVSDCFFTVGHDAPKPVRKSVPKTFYEAFTDEELNL